MLWIVTPLCYLYVLWNLVTIAPSLYAGRPASTGVLSAFNIIVLCYCAIEIPFSLYHQYLIRQAQKIREPPVYSRRFLRQLFAKSLENGMDTEEEIDAILRSPVTEKKEFISGNSSDATLDGTVVNEKGSSKPCSADTLPLAPDDPRALDFQSHIRLWFHDIPYDAIGREDMIDWLSWSIYTVSHEDLVADRIAWEKAGKPVKHLEGVPDDDEDEYEIAGDKLGLVEHCLELVEARAGKPFPPGRNPKVKVIRLTLDKVRVFSRPFILYAFVWAAQRLVVRRHTPLAHSLGSG